MSCGLLSHDHDDHHDDHDSRLHHPRTGSISFIIHNSIIVTTTTTTTTSVEHGPPLDASSFERHFFFFFLPVVGGRPTVQFGRSSVHEYRIDFIRPLRTHCRALQSPVWFEYRTPQEFCRRHGGGARGRTSRRCLAIHLPLDHGIATRRRLGDDICEFCRWIKVAV